MNLKNALILDLKVFFLEIRVPKKTGHPHPFYGKDILAKKEQAFMQTFLAKYRKETVNEELKTKIWNDLQKEKFLGHLTIPFKVVLRRDIYGKYPDFIEIILDTKV